MPAAARRTPAALDPDAPPALDVLRRFRQVFNAVRRHLRHTEKRVGVGGAQLRALAVIQRRPGLGVGALAAALDVHQTTASNLVKTLVAARWVATRRSGTDRRAVQLTLLPAGQRVLRKAPRAWAGTLPAALGRLDRSTLERLERDLAALLAALQGDERARSRLPLAPA